MWPLIIGAAAGALMKGSQAKEANKQRQRQLMVESIKNQYSPYTGERGDVGGVQGSQNVFQNMIGGGLQGATIASLYGGASGAAGASGEGAEYGNQGIGSGELGYSIPDRNVTSGIRVNRPSLNNPTSPVSTGLANTQFPDISSTRNAVPRSRAGDYTPLGFSDRYNLDLASLRRN